MSDKLYIPHNLSNAQDNLTHYLTLLMNDTGRGVGTDNVTEFNDIITPLVEYILNLEQRIVKLEKQQTERSTTTLPAPTDGAAKLKKAQSGQLYGRIMRTVDMLKANPNETDERILKAVMDSWKVTKPTASKYIRLAKRRLEWQTFLADCRKNGIVVTKTIVDHWHDEHPYRGKATELEAVQS